MTSAAGSTILSATGAKNNPATVGIMPTAQSAGPPNTPPPSSQAPLLATLPELHRDLALVAALHDGQVHLISGLVLAQGGEQIPGGLDLF